MKKKDLLIVVRGGGDIATGTIYTLWKSGFRVLVLETEYPSAIRRQVAVCEAVYHGEALVEDLRVVRIPVPLPKPTLKIEENTGVTHGKDSTLSREWLLQEIDACYEKGVVPLMIDPEGESISILKPQVVVDAILAKKNLGTKKTMATMTIALGPGFEAGVDVDYVIETMRGHNLGRVMEKGFALPNTGVPGVIAGYDKERVIHSPAKGRMQLVHQIGDFVNQGEVIARVEQENGEQVPIYASITGLIRGLITENYPVTEGLKITDIDPRKQEYDNCFTISDKARCIAGSVLGLVCRLVE